MSIPIKSENELKLEYRAILALIRSWPIKWQKELITELKNPPDMSGGNISEVKT